jgi:hypothetical protein
MQVQESKSPETISAGNVARRDLIPALKGLKEKNSIMIRTYK